MHSFLAPVASTVIVPPTVVPVHVLPVHVVAAPVQAPVAQPTTRSPSPEIDGEGTLLAEGGGSDIYIYIYIYIYRNLFQIRHIYPLFYSMNTIAPPIN